MKRMQQCSTTASAQHFSARRSENIPVCADVLLASAFFSVRNLLNVGISLICSIEIVLIQIRRIVRRAALTPIN